MSILNVSFLISKNTNEENFMKDFIVIEDGNVSKFMEKVNQALADGYFVINAERTTVMGMGGGNKYYAFLAKN